jgi:hypothetical protein
LEVLIQQPLMKLSVPHSKYQSMDKNAMSASTRAEGLEGRSDIEDVSGVLFWT